MAPPPPLMLVLFAFGPLTPFCPVAPPAPPAVTMEFPSPPGLARLLPPPPTETITGEVVLSNVTERGPATATAQVVDVTGAASTPRRHAATQTGGAGPTAPPTATK